MAWIFLAALADSASHSNHGCEQSPIVNETDTLKLCCCRELLLANSTELQSGMTLHRSLGPCFQVSTSSSEGSHVRTSALQEVAQAWQESEAVFIRTSKDLSEKQSQLSSFLKTSLRSGLADLVVWCGDWPRSGMISDGQLFLLQVLERHTKETDGSYLPTPTAKTYGSNKGGAAGRIGKERLSLDSMARKNLWPTPVARDWKGTTGKNRYTQNLPNLLEKNGGKLNPTWVEWLMGFRLEWTALDAWAIQWFQSKREKRSKSYQESEV